MLTKQFRTPKFMRKTIFIERRNGSYRLERIKNSTSVMAKNRDIIPFTSLRQNGF